MDVPVIEPVFVTVKEPPLVVMIDPDLLKFVPTKLIPAGVLVSIFPTRNVVPVPASWITDAAEIDEAWLLRTVVAFKTPTRVTEPIAPAKISLPAVKVRLQFPSTVATVISPLDVPELRMTFAVNVIAPAKERAELFVETLLPKLTAPTPV